MQHVLIANSLKQHKPFVRSKSHCISYELVIARHKWVGLKSVKIVQIK